MPEPEAPPILHLICGKAASGKSTLCAELGAHNKTIVISEDVWLSALFGDQMETLKDYQHFAVKLREVVGPHVVALLQSGLSVVMDFPANTVESRAWMRGLFEIAGTAHQLHVLDTPDEVCLARLKARNEAGDHPFAATEEQFRQLLRHYAPPTSEENFEVIIHKSDG